MRVPRCSWSSRRPCGGCSSSWPSGATPTRSRRVTRAASSRSRRTRTADRASDLLAATAALGYLQPHAGLGRARGRSASTERIQGLVSELIAVQNDGRRLALGRGHATARATARPPPASSGPSPRPSRFGLLTDAQALDKAAAYLTQEFAKVGGGDHDTRDRSPARAEHPPQGHVRAGQHPQPGPAGPLRRCARLPAPDAREPRPRSARRRGPRRARRPGQDRSRPSPAIPHAATGKDKAPCRSTADAVEATAPGGPGFCPRPAPGRPDRQGERLAPRPPQGDRLAAAQGQGSGPRRPGRLLRHGPDRRGPLRPRRHVNDAEVCKPQVAGDRPRARPSSSPARPSRPADKNRVQFAIDGRGHVRLRRDADRLHPRLRPRQDPRQPHRPDRPPRSTTGRCPSWTARSCPPASASRSTRSSSRTRPAKWPLGGKASIT